MSETVTSAGNKAPNEGVVPEEMSPTNGDDGPYYALKFGRWEIDFFPHNHFLDIVHYTEDHSRLDMCWETTVHSREDVLEAFVIMQCDDSRIASAVLRTLGRLYNWKFRGVLGR